MGEGVGGRGEKRRVGENVKQLYYLEKQNFFLEMVTYRP